MDTDSEQNKTQNQGVDDASADITLQDGDNTITDVIPDKIIDLSNSIDAIKEITMTSFYEMVDEKPKPQYSIKKITVNKGDLVRIKVTVTKGMHDFKIDEFNIYTDTKELNKEYVIEFTADKVGEFIYYCTKTGHRVNGHWGVLVVKG